ncbi:MAG: pilus assembly PilX N-terminal domain-containing protein [candidate division Zixibacteria bacterium]
MIGIKYFNKVKASEKGTAILIVMALIAMLTSVAIMSVNRSTTDIDLSYNQLQEDKAFYIAEAGLHRAMTELNANSSWRNGYYKQVLNGGYYNISFVDSLTDSTLIDTLIISAQGYFDKSISNLEAWVVPEYYRPFQYAAYGDDSVLLDNNVCTDSYNSDSGTYAATQINQGGDLGSNGQIELTNSATVNGNIQTSDTGNINIEWPSVLNGDSTSTAPVINFSQVSDDDFAWAETVNNAPAGFSGGYTYDPSSGKLSLSARDTLVLASGVYYFSDIELRNSANIQLAPGAEVTIYMTGDLTLAQSSSMNAWREIDPITNNKITFNGNPKDFVVYSKGDNFTLGNLTRFSGAFLSVTADIVLEQNVDAYGSFVGKSVTVANSSCVHFDRDLLKYTTKKVKAMHLIAWKQN